MSLASLAYLACPIMMIACMAPMFRKEKNKNDRAQGQQSTSNVQPEVSYSQDEIQALQLRIADLMEENHKLKIRVQDSVNYDTVLCDVEDSREKKAMS